MKETYNSNIKSGIGRVQLSTVVSNSFPLVGDSVRLSSAMKWAQTVSFKTESSAGVPQEDNRTEITQSQTKDVAVSSEGDLKQVIIAGNSISSKEEIKYLYAIQPRTEPYYNLELTKEIIRNDGEATQIKITSENGYDLSRECTISLCVYKENSDVLIKSLTRDDFTLSDNILISDGITVLQRGIYDISIDYTDTTANVTISKQINKLLTVTPALAPRPTQSQIDNKEYTVMNTVSYMDNGVRKTCSDKVYETAPGKYYIEWIMPQGQPGSGYYPNLDVSKYPKGSTLVLKYDPEQNGQKYHMRLLLTGNKPCSVSNENGTPNFTYDEPLVITFDQETPFTIWGVYYAAVNFNDNMRNTVFDGRGYYNLSKGLRIDRFSDDLYFEDCMMLLNGTSDVEIFEVEMCNSGFTAIASKTDPDPNRPWYWKGNFAEENFILHHCHVHDTSGEGFYLGYFDCATQKKTNNNGAAVSYQPHSMEKTRIFRNFFERTGYDGMQLSNARNSEVCHNTIIKGAYKNEANQATGISIQSIQGKIYNNLVVGFNGPGIQTGPLGDLEIFNNIVNNASDGGGGIQFLWSVDTPEQDPDGNGINTTTKILVHNNMLIAKHICIN
ncbi:MAG: hypothetical protein PHC95_15865, partial [Parabacteroides sp.]|nr:hypothetical protein [Parabacteroides sp.]